MGVMVQNKMARFFMAHVVLTSVNNSGTKYFLVKFWFTLYHCVYLVSPIVSTILVWIKIFAFSTGLLGHTQVQKSVRDIFYQRYRGYDSSVRSQALKLMLSSSSSLTAEDVADIAAQSTDRWNTDYSLYIQARLFDAARRNDTIRSAAD